MRLGHTRDRARVKYFQDAALNAAGATRRVMAQVGGDQSASSSNGLAVEGKKAKGGAAAGGPGGRRKVKVAMVEGNEQRGYLELIVKDGEVFLVRHLPVSALLSGVS